MSFEVIKDAGEPPPPRRGLDKTGLTSALRDLEPGEALAIDPDEGER